MRLYAHLKRHVGTGGALLCLVLGACSSSGDVVDITKFKAPTLGDMFAKPDWADTTGSTKRIASRALTQDDYVNADGTCASSAPAPVAAAPVENKPEGSEDPAAPAATPASAPVAPEPAAPASPRVIGGIGLGMSECDVVQRAGTPGRVDLSAGEKSDRNLVLTYMSGDRPGIYRFRDGRLVSIERVAVAEPEKPKKPVKTAAKPKPKTAAASDQPARAAPPAKKQSAKTQWPAPPASQARGADTTNWPAPPPPQSRSAATTNWPAPPPPATTQQ